jgi:hypothetical protein
VRFSPSERSRLMLGPCRYWRIDPNIKFFCDVRRPAGSPSLLISTQVDYDPFLFMQQNNKKYGFTSQSPPAAGDLAQLPQ